MNTETWLSVTQSIDQLKELALEQVAALKAERDQAIRERDVARAERDSLRARVSWVSGRFT